LTRYKKQILALSISIVASTGLFAEEENEFFEDTLSEVVEMLEDGHYSKAPLDDAMSERWFNLYIDWLDPAKMFFTVNDIDDFSVFKTELDDLAHDQSLKAFDVINERYKQRTSERYQYVLALLETDINAFDFTVDETMIRSREDAPWSKDAKEANELWRKYVKNAALSLKLAGKDDDKIMETLRKRYKAQERRFAQRTREDGFNSFVNTLTLAYDPHSGYLSPRDMENFRINMSLQLEGIGAVLQQDGEFTKIRELVNNGPADKTEKIRATDRIIAVGQGRPESAEMVDVIGWRLDEVVDLIRGEKGSWVSLEIIDSTEDLATARTIEIQREAVQLEESAASGEVSEVWDGEQVRKVGVITIPKFYMDMEAYQKGDANFRSTSRDVYEILIDMQKQGVEGIVVDLRNNGGGALFEANLLTDLFIDPGVVVQIRNADKEVSRRNRARQPMMYKGPLVVLTNRLSASASEIFAGAIQDYQRGIIVGTPTFGKGTVQSVEPFDGSALKLTQSMFYRVNGRSTQFDGVTPDVLFPLQYNPEDIGESAYKYALNGTPIAEVSHNTWIDTNYYTPSLQELHQARTGNDPDFNFLRARYELHQEIADMLGVTKKVVEYRIYSAFDRLRSELEEFKIK